MGHLSWVKIQRVFRSETSPESPGKNRIKWSRPSGSFSFLKNASRWSSLEERDDSSSFMSPEPEDYRWNSLDSPHGLALPDSYSYDQWNQARTDAVRLSFVQCTELLSFFPNPPTASHPRTDPSRRRLSYPRPPVPSAFRSTEAVQNDDRSIHSYWNHGEVSKPRRRRLRKARGRTPTPFPHPIRYGPLKNSPLDAHAIPFDLLSRAEQAKLLERPARLNKTVASRSSPFNSASASDTSEVSTAAITYRSRRNSTRRRSFQELREPRISVDESFFYCQPLSAPASETLFAPTTLPPRDGPLFHVPGLERRSRPPRTTTSLFNDSPISPLWL